VSFIRVSDRNCVVGGVLVVLAYLVAFAGDGLLAYFTPDDMMNLYFAWFRPLSEADRPIGAAFYRAMFAAFGLNPLPYRIACFVLLLVNLALLYRLCVRLSGSREIGALACLLGVYHAHLADLYYSTGTVYDLLCCAFFLGALVYYAEIRQCAGLPGWRQMLVFLTLYIFALGAKEMAVTLPVLLLLHDALYHPAESAGVWIRRETRILAGPALVTAAFIGWKIAGPGGVLDNPDYHPHLTWSALVEAWKHYAFDLFYGTAAFSAWRVVLLWAVMLGIALAARRRALLFGFGFVFVGILPVAFIPPRGFFAIYLTLPGWYLFGATALVAGRDLLARRTAALFVVVAVALFPLHWHQKPLGNRWVAGAHESVRNVVEGIQYVAGPLPRRARVLFLSDPYPKDEWMLTFIFRLHYRDDGIQVDRVRAMRTLPDPVAQAAYDHTFRLDGAGLTLVR
jgi:hypothetical protein